MSQSEKQISTIFDVQRTTLAQTQRAMKQSMDLGMETGRIMLRGMEGAPDLREQGTTLTKAGVDMWFDAMTAMVPGSAEGMAELRQSVHEQLDAAGEMSDDTWATMESLAQQNLEMSEELVEDYETVLDDGFDAVMAATEQAEDQAVSAAEAVEVEIEE